MRFTRKNERPEDAAANRQQSDPEPPDLGTLIVAAAASAVTDGPAGPTAPNDFTVAIIGYPADDDTIAATAEALERIITETALEREWRLEGVSAVRFTFTPGEESVAGIETAVAPGPLRPWAQLHRVAGDDMLAIHHGRAVIGRAATADVVVEHDTVSRRHALIVRTPDGARLADLGSSNGTYLNGKPVGEPIDVLAGDVVKFGDASYAFRPPGTT